MNAKLPHIKAWLAAHGDPSGALRRLRSVDDGWVLAYRDVHLLFGHDGLVVGHVGSCEVMERWDPTAKMIRENGKYKVSTWTGPSCSAR